MFIIGNLLCKIDLSDTEPIKQDFNSLAACANTPCESRHFDMVEIGAYVAEVNGEPSNAIQDNSIVDILVHDPEQTDDEHLENSQNNMWKGRQFCRSWFIQKNNGKIYNVHKFLS